MILGTALRERAGEKNEHCEPLQTNWGMAEGQLS